MPNLLFTFSVIFEERRLLQNRFISLLLSPILMAFKLSLQLMDAAAFLLQCFLKYLFGNK